MNPIRIDMINAKILGPLETLCSHLGSIIEQIAVSGYDPSDEKEQYIVCRESQDRQLFSGHHGKKHHMNMKSPQAGLSKNSLNYSTHYIRESKSPGLNDKTVGRIIEATSGIKMNINHSDKNESKEEQKIVVHESQSRRIHLFQNENMEFHILGSSGSPSKTKEDEPDEVKARGCEAAIPTGDQEALTEYQELRTVKQKIKGFRIKINNINDNLLPEDNLLTDIKLSAESSNIIPRIKENLKEEESHSCKNISQSQSNNQCAILSRKTDGKGDQQDVYTIKAPINKEDSTPVPLSTQKSDSPAGDTMFERKINNQQNHTIPLSKDLNLLENRALDESAIKDLVVSMLIDEARDQGIEV